MEPRAYRSGAAGTPPRFPASSQLGFARAAAGDLAATIPGPWWFFMNGEEARNLMIRGNVAPRVDDNTQMLRAILNMVASVAASRA